MQRFLSSCAPGTLLCSLWFQLRALHDLSDGLDQKSLSNVDLCGLLHTVIYRYELIAILISTDIPKGCNMRKSLKSITVFLTGCCVF